MKIIYILEIYTWDYDWEKTNFEFFLTEKEANKRKEEIFSKISDYMKMHTKIDITKRAFNDIKDIMTISDYEQLFKVKILEN